MGSQTVLSHAISLPHIVGERSLAVAKQFGVDTLVAKPTKRRRRVFASIALPSPGKLMLLAGPSGSGKSSLLHSLRRRAKATGARIVNLRRIPLPEVPILDLFDLPTDQTLKRLARVGLAEVWTWLRPPAQLSEGQRWRLRMALALERSTDTTQPTLLLCDEFAAVLDRVSACVVSAVLRRAINASPHLSAMVATSHDDLANALDPDVQITCDFGAIIVHDRASD